jgi:hypothetical protein
MDKKPQKPARLRTTFNSGGIGRNRKKRAKPKPKSNVWVDEVSGLTSQQLTDVQRELKRQLYARQQRDSQ